LRQTSPFSSVFKALQALAPIPCYVQLSRLSVRGGEQQID
jgi:hypothetical protein